MRWFALCFGLLPAMAVVVGCNGSPQGPPAAAGRDSPRSAAAGEDVLVYLKHVKQWADSLKGLTVDEARNLLGPIQPEESTWKHLDQQGISLEYKVSPCSIELYCSEGRVVMVSIDFVPQ